MSRSRTASIDIDAKTQAVLRRKNYKVLVKLNHGAFGQVYKGVNLNDGELVAVKTMDLDKQSTTMKEKYIPGELAAMINCRHEHIIRVHDIIRANNRLYIFMEFAANGDLNQLIRKNKGLYEVKGRKLFYQTIKALAYAHAELRIAHRDIKAENVLLDATYSAKLSDFGFATECWDSRRKCVIRSTTILGTLPYFCPQLLTRVPYNAYLADVWAMGVMLYFMLHCRFPFSMEGEKQQLQDQVNYPYVIKSRLSGSLSNGAVDLILQMLNPNEKSRISVRESLSHPWILSEEQKNSTSSTSILKTLYSKRRTSSARSASSRSSQSSRSSRSSQASHTRFTRTRI